MTENDPYRSQHPSAQTQPPESYEYTRPLFSYDAPQPPWAPAPAPSGKAGRPSGAVVAGLLAAAVAVGGIAGVAGAAGYVALDDNATGTSTNPTSSTVISSDDDSPAAAGTVQQVAAQVLPSVVKINVAGPAGSGSGSGVIISSDGEILTNNHVVESAVDGGELAVSFNDGTTARASVVGTDPLTDLAVIKAADVSGLTPAKLNASDSVDVGEQVVAIGSPFGLEATVTSGIVSALDRPVSVPGQGNVSATTYPAIQTDAAINPGNSGGALVNMSGEVVGINSSIRTASDSSGQGGSIGLGFAIPISKLIPIVEQIRDGETATHAKLGVTVDDAVSDNGLVTGASVRSVEPGSAADGAGLQVGDVVTKVDDKLISGSTSLVATIRGMRPDDDVSLTIVRGGDTQTLDATLDSDGGTPGS